MIQFDWKFFLLIALIGVGAWQGYAKRSATAGETGVVHDQVIMYSLTTCGYCTAKRREMNQEGIAFVEYFLDREQGRADELTEKLMAAKINPGSVGVPTLDVHGTMLPNNPSLNLIRKHMRN